MSKLNHWYTTEEILQDLSDDALIELRDDVRYEIDRRKLAALDADIKQASALVSAATERLKSLDMTSPDVNDEAALYIERSDAYMWSEAAQIRVQRLSIQRDKMQDQLWRLTKPDDDADSAVDRAIAIKRLGPYSKG